MKGSGGSYATNSARRSSTILAREETITLIPVNRILSTPMKDVHDANYFAIRDSIRSVGVINPIHVVLRGNDFKLLDGRHRVRACREIGIPIIPATVSTMTDNEITESMLLASHHRVETSKEEYKTCLQRLIKQHPELTEEEIATKLGKTVRWLREKLK